MSLYAKAKNAHIILVTKMGQKASLFSMTMCAWAHYDVFSRQ